ncbi:hypothetical protein [Streptomyces sp. NPDC088816]|uniref:hypothetical protein n=1 Tax=Streptomyces sp. NPDC088816 TaxID=3365906 RepID=UPI0038063190
MRRRTLLITAATVAVAGIITGLVVWLSHPSYDDVVKGCATALKEQYAQDGQGKPDACHDVKADDYSALVLQAAMGDLGWLDDDGKFDKNKMIDDVTEDQ